MNNATLPLCVLALFCFKNLKAQDPHFSQFYANRVYLNPAYAGFDPGTTIILNYRDQWPGIPDGDVPSSPTSYRTFNATGDFRVPCFTGNHNFALGLAGSVFHDDAGRAPLVTQGAGIALSAAQRLNMKGHRRSIDYLDIRVGAQISMMQRKINGDYFIYSNQLNPYFGLISDPSTLNLRSGLYPNLNVGAMVNLGNKQFTMSAGFSMSNVLQPDQALYDSPASDILPSRYTGHIGLTAEVGNNFFVSPQARADFQSGFDLGLFSAGLYLQNDQMYGGLFYQWNKNTIPQLSIGDFQATNVSHLIFNFGIDIQSIIDLGNTDRLQNRFILGASYDFSLAGLDQGDTRGGLELTLRMFFDGGRNASCLEEKRYNYKRCPVTH